MLYQDLKASIRAWELNTECKRWAPIQMGSVDKARTLLRRIHRGAIRLFHRGPQEEGKYWGLYVGKLANHEGGLS